MAARPSLVPPLIVMLAPFPLGYLAVTWVDSQGGELVGAMVHGLVVLVAATIFALGDLWAISAVYRRRPLSNDPVAFAAWVLVAMGTGLMMWAGVWGARVILGESEGEFSAIVAAGFIYGVMIVGLLGTIACWLPIRSGAVDAGQGGER